MAKSIQDRLKSLERQTKGLCCKTQQISENTEPKYKVFTANLYQEGISNISSIVNTNLSIGTTYQITNTDGDTADFTNVGAPNNDAGTFFIATGTTPNSWGDSLSGVLDYDAGAPVANVLENTLGNVSFVYANTGHYELQSNSLFTTGKTTAIMSTPIDAGDNSAPGTYSIGFVGDTTISIYTIRLTDLAQRNTYLFDTFIEVRVYN